MIRFFGWCFAVTVFVFISFNSAAQDMSRVQAVEASVQIQESPPVIQLVWAQPELPAARYRISKRAVGDAWSEAAVVDGGATSWTDGNIVAGQRYEYRIIKETNDGYLGHSYLMAGIRAPMLEDTGKVLLLVRDNVASAAGAELEQFRKDLILEGWEVLRQDVSEGAMPPQVRSVIQDAYNSSGGTLKQVVLIGHVAVPYSGYIMPDGHANHAGAWPADGYYADVDGVWTDSTVNTKTAERDVNWNVPGDGKFDQDQYPSVLKLAVGRIDFYLMTCYANKANSRSEIDLTRQYLNKDHAFRSGQWQVARRGLVLDNFGLRDTNGVSATAWMNFAAFFGASANSKMDLNTYFPRLTSESALWTWTAGGGSYYYSSGIGTADDYALNDINVVFSLTLGSYFGDWNNESNWTKAALGSGKVLVSIYSGIPRSFFHAMALGGTIGESFLLTENNNFRDAYLPDTQGTHEVHQALLGDPTLRMWPMPGVPSVGAKGGFGTADLSWNNPSGEGFLGVHLYRGTSSDGPFTRITAEPVTGMTYRDTVDAGTYVYMARPIYLQSNGSGSFLDPGQGQIVGNVFVEPPRTVGPPILSVSKTAPDTITLQVLAARGQPCTIDTCTGLGSWTPMDTRTSLQGEPLRWDIHLGNGPILFYRARY
jgi:hypothetical protein